MSHFYHGNGPDPTMVHDRNPRELARAIRRLRSALAVRNLADHESEPWVVLRELEELSKERYVALAKGQRAKIIDSRLA